MVNSFSSFGFVFLMFVLFVSGFPSSCCCFENQFCVLGCCWRVLFFWGGLRVRWSGRKGPHHLALNPPCLFFCDSIFVFFFLFCHQKSQNLFLPKKRRFLLVCSVSPLFSYQPLFTTRFTLFLFVFLFSFFLPSLLSLFLSFLFFILLLVFRSMITYMKHANMKEKHRRKNRKDQKKKNKKKTFVFEQIMLCYNI